MILLEHVEKTFDICNTVLKDVNAEINDGDIISVIGPSGTGKTTLLRCLNMLDAPTGGRIFLDGEEITGKHYPISEVHRKIMTVFQGYNLFEHLSVIENIMLPQITVLRRSKQEAYDTGMKFLSSVGMSQKSMRYPSTLSGGQKQRVAIARTLAMNPEVILFDEPTSALDPSTAEDVKAVIRNTAKNGTTVLIVTHDMELAKSIGNRVFYMDQGIIYEEGSPEQIFNNPQKERTAQFVRKSKNLSVDIIDGDYNYSELMSKISSFGINNQIETHTVRNIQLVSEELVYSLLLKKLNDPLAINISYQYTESPDNAEITVSYSGEHYNILDKKTESNSEVSDDRFEISLILLNRLIRKSEYIYDETDKLPNKITINIK